MLLFLNASKVFIFSYDARVFDGFVSCGEESCFLGAILFKGCFFLYKKFMSAKFLFLLLPHDCDMTKNILKA